MASTSTISQHFPDDRASREWMILSPLPAILSSLRKRTNSSSPSASMMVEEEEDTHNKGLFLRPELSDDLVELIASFSDAHSLVRMKYVSKTWNRIASKSRYWNAVLVADFGVTTQQLVPKIPANSSTATTTTTSAPSSSSRSNSLLDPFILYKTMALHRAQTLRHNATAEAAQHIKNYNRLSSDAFRAVLMYDRPQAFINRGGGGGGYR